MNVGFVASSFLGLALLSSAANAAPVDPSAVWLTEDGRARVLIDKCGPTKSNVCGYVVWLKTPRGDDGQPRRDIKNPDASKRDRPTLGHQLIMGLKATPENHYDGRIYNAEDGNQYNVTIWVDQPEELKVKGCLLAFLCSTQTWKRVTDTAPGQLAGAVGAPNGPVPDAEWAPRPSPSAAPAPKPVAPRPAQRP